MNQKELGSTNVRLPEIGLGTWKYKGGSGPPHCLGPADCYKNPRTSGLRWRKSAHRRGLVPSRRVALSSRGSIGNRVKRDPSRLSSYDHDGEESEFCQPRY